VPTNEQRRATAKRKLERQLERRVQQEKRRQLFVVIGGVVAIVVAAALVATFVLTNKDKKDTATASTSAPSSAPAEPGGPTDAPPPTGGLPAFKPSANLGANCQYPATSEPASKKVDPPRSGKVPTTPATVSVSMSTTDRGNLGLILDNAKAPCTVNSFASLAQKGYFDNTPCHRLTTSPSLSVLQCGDPTGSGTGGPGYQFANEYPTDQYPQGDPALDQPVTYPRGTLAMANAGPGTNGSQFFLVYKDSQLPPNYTAFGTIDATGLATLDKIAAAGVAGGGQDGKPATPVTLKSVLLD
jgi:peptidyl-prolyl cis-trans isomerase B (cyclophilin B)